MTASGGVGTFAVQIAWRKATTMLRGLVTVLHALPPASLDRVRL